MGMAWIETESLSFVARHEAEDSDSAQRTLDALEDLRLRLEERFDEAPGEITVIVHPTPGLARRRPPVPSRRSPGGGPGRDGATWPGWAMASELHVLNDDYLDRRAAGEDSLAALRGTAERLYVQIVVGANNDRLPPPWGPRRFLRYLRWTWLIEGAAQYYAGQVAAVPRRRQHAACATARRPRSRPRLATRSSSAARSSTCSSASAARTPATCSPRASVATAHGGSLELAFDARFRDIERAWRDYLRNLSERRLESSEAIAEPGAPGRASLGLARPLPGAGWRESGA